MPAVSPPVVALLITQLDPGGAERALTKLALGLDRQRFTPLVISIRPRPRGDQALLVEQLEQAGIRVEFLNARSKLQFPLALIRLRGILRSSGARLVQSFLFHANVLAALGAKWAGIPAVAGVRVADPSRSRQIAEGLLAGLFARYVCVSQSVANFCQQKCGVPAEKITVIPNGVDVAAIDAARPVELASLGIASDRRLWISVGRLDKQKGHGWLLPILKRVFAQLPQHDLLLVGDGPEREALQRQARDLGLASRIHFLGWRSDVSALLKASELFLLPSRWEGMPNALLEAMAAGLPVVAMLVEGVAEILGPLSDEQGVVPGLASGFEEKLLSLAASASSRSSLGRANQDRVLHEFSLASAVQAYEQIYITLMKS
jgi:glycosyltransferase involved in cell wall biosynthesis